MDGMRANPNVTVIAATNRPQDIDPAMKRPGRFDKIITLEMPDAIGRVKILNVHAQKAEKNKTAPELLFAENVDWNAIGEQTEGMSGADLSNLINLTLEEKINDELEGKEWTAISTEDLTEMIGKLVQKKENRREMGFA
jgi:cell division protease FtsH